jgi:hypothetical protein
MIPNRGNIAGHLAFIAQVKPLFIESVPKQFSILTPAIPSSDQAVPAPSWKRGQMPIWTATSVKDAALCTPSFCMR